MAVESAAGSNPTHAAMHVIITGRKRIWHASAKQISEGRSKPAIRHVNQVDAGHLLEQFTCNMACGAGARRRHADLAAIGLSVRDELGNCFGWDQWIDHHDVGLAADACHRRDVANEIEIELVVERRVNRVDRSHEEERVPVSGRTHSRLGADIGACAGPVFDDELLAEGSDSHCPIRRAMMSVPPAGANPTMMRTGRAG